MDERQQKDLASAIHTVVREMNHIYGIVKQVPKDEEKYAEFEQEKKDMGFSDELAELTIDLIRERKMCELYRKWNMGSIAYALQASIDADSLTGIITDRVGSSK